MTEVLTQLNIISKMHLTVWIEKKRCAGFVGKISKTFLNTHILKIRLIYNRLAKESMLQINNQERIQKPFAYKKTLILKPILELIKK